MNRSCKSSQGIVLARTKRGDIAGTKVNGHFWSDALDGSYTNEQPRGGASAACAKMGMRLPSKQDFDSLRRAFDMNRQSRPPKEEPTLTEPGRAELHKVFGRADHFFWSSSFDRSGHPWGFGNDDGSLRTAPPWLDHAVMCIVP